MFFGAQTATNKPKIQLKIALCFGRRERLTFEGLIGIFAEK
jgi:hypothetical protein